MVARLTLDQLIKVRILVSQFVRPASPVAVFFDCANHRGNFICLLTLESLAINSTTLYRVVGLEVTTKQRGFSGLRLAHFSCIISTR
jgi:hypothetical protein